MSNDKPVEVLPGVYAIAGGGVNMYLVDDPKTGVTLIDAGLPGSATRVLKCLEVLHRPPSALKRILVTHADVDHVGDLSRIVRLTQAEVWAGTESVPFLRDHKSPPHLPFPVGAIVAAINTVVRRPTAVSRTLKDGELLDIFGGIQVLAAPGHTQDHMCYFAEQHGILFAGDLFENRKRLALYPRFDWDHAQALRSARRALTLEPRIVCPGHGRVWRESRRPDEMTALRDSLAEG